MIVIASSDPATASVAPPGGTRRLITPNPLAAGWPTVDGAALLDIGRILLQALAAYQRGLAGRSHQICYAMKANSTLAIARLLRELDTVDFSTDIERGQGAMDFNAECAGMCGV